MVEVQPAYDPFFQCAYAMLVLSYLAWNELVLRIILLLANILFILEGIIIIDVAVDVVVWCGAIVIVTIFYIVLIIYRNRTIHFDADFDALYNSVFSDVLTRHEFNLMIKKKVLKSHSIKAIGSQIVLAGNPFDYMYILGDCTDSTISLAHGQFTDGSNLLLDRMVSYAWIGCVEYIEQEISQEPQLYKVSAYLAESKESFVYYTIDLARLKRQMNKKNTGMSIQNAFLAKMLGYLTSYLRKADKRYIRAKSTLKTIRTSDL